MIMILILTEKSHDEFHVAVAVDFRWDKRENVIRMMMKIVKSNF